ncbi:hypothetical protein HYU95_02420 [Candidatus Daviesbacteria bacterium]|nr:hypothetical protein [Candidatus Daviesbacteria bacterium]
MPVKSTARSKKVTETPVAEDANVEVALNVKPTAKVDPFNILIKSISELQAEFERLQKEISQTKEVWLIEQKAHQKSLEDRNIQEELERKRNQETYEYETARKRKQEEDMFADKKALWEKHLSEQKEAIEKDRKELEELRKLVTAFEGEKEKAVEDAQVILQKELTGSFENERKMREQEVKAEKEILTLHLSNLSSESSRQTAEIQALKKALEEATSQVKEIAVKVIESGTKTRQDLTNDL